MKQSTSLQLAIAACDIYCMHLTMFVNACRCRAMYFGGCFVAAMDLPIPAGLTRCPRGCGMLFGTVSMPLHLGHCSFESTKRKNKKRVERPTNDDFAGSSSQVLLDKALESARAAFSKQA